MSNPRPPTAPRPKSRTGLAWHEYNSLPPTPAPVVEPRAGFPPGFGAGGGNVPLGGPPGGRRGRSAKGKVLLSLSAAVVVGVLVGVVLFFAVGRSQRGGSTSPSSVATSVVSPSPEPPATSPPAVDPLPAEMPRMNTRHIQISVQPGHASLSLDEDVAPAGVISVDVPPDRAPHTVRATAPGYLPYKRTITFANDVLLEVKLKRATQADSPSDDPVPAAPRVAGPPSSTGRNDGSSDPRVGGKPDTKPTPIITPIEDFGMDLQRPAPRRPTKKLDETDPYAP